VHDNAEANGIHGVKHSTIIFVAAFKFDSDLLIEAIHGKLHESTFHDGFEGFVVVRGNSNIILAHAIYYNRCVNI